MQQKDLKDICRILYPNTKQYTFSSAAHGSFSKIDHVLRHKTNLNRWGKIETTPCVLVNHSALKFKINNNHNSSKCNQTTYYWMMNMLKKKEVEIFLKLSENENAKQQNSRDRLKASLQAKFIALSAYIKNSKKTQIDGLTWEFGKQEQTKSKLSRWQEIIKNQSRNKIETKSNAAIIRNGSLRR